MTKQIDAKSAEEYVRAKWEGSGVARLIFSTPLLPSDSEAFWITLYVVTLQCEEAIRLKREEIVLMHRDNFLVSEGFEKQRIISILEAQLAELTCGMKEKME